MRLDARDRPVGFRPAALLELVLGMALVFAIQPALAAPSSSSGLVAVALLPLSPGEGVTKKQARGIFALVTKVAAAHPELRLAKARRDDRRGNRKCRKRERKGEAAFASCLGNLAYQRDAALLATGEVRAGEAGFVLSLVVVEEKGEALLRRIEEPLSGDDLEGGIDRALRRAFVPEALTGQLVVTGNPEGSRVYVDDRNEGRLPTREIGGLLEGEHEVRVTREGHFPFERTVAVRYSETTTVEVTLVPRRRAATSDEEAEAESPAFLPWVGPAGLGAAAVVAGLVGAGFGTVVLVDVGTVERRAEAQQLLFPADAELVARGRTFSTLANIAYGVAALAGLAGTGWAAAVFALQQAGRPDDAADFDEGRERIEKRREQERERQRRAREERESLDEEDEELFVGDEDDDSDGDDGGKDPASDPRRSRP